MSRSVQDFSRPCPRDGFYEIFISFRGTDTRNGFTDTLYHLLLESEVYTFIDKDLAGEAIESLFKKIEKSRMAVVVYSEHFASSAWCLRELELIMRRWEEEKMLILPIFYKVDIHDVKHLPEKISMYFDEHIKNYDEDNAKKWKDAVTKIGNISGYAYQDIYSRTERDFITQDILPTIKKKLRTSGPSSGEDYPVRSGPSSSRDAGFDANYKDEGGLVNTMVEDVMEKLKKLDNSSPAIQTLSHKQKYILLNMACFWIGKLKYAPNYVWEYHFNGSVLHEIEELKLKSLIKIDKYKYYWIDDDLRNRALAILQNEYNDKAGRQVWLWRSGDTANLLKENNELLPHVEAICLNGDQKCIEAKQLRNLPNLRFIEIRRADIAGDFQDAFQKVSYLRVAATFTHTIQNLSLENIVVLDLSGSGVGDDWKWSTMKAALKMKDLSLSSCHQLIQGPKFSDLFPKLERLDVEGCKQLKSIDVSGLLELKDLDASNCKSLEDVYGLGMLIRSLKWMDISGCKAIKILPDIKSKLIKLGVLNC